MNEAQVHAFWQAHPCGDQQVGGLDQAFRGDYGGVLPAVRRLPAIAARATSWAA